jgi:hypothetical protein
VAKEQIPIHGPDHCPGGPDPLPCLTTTDPACAYITWTDGATIADATYTTFTSLSNTGWSSYTNDASIFTFDTNNGNILIGSHGGFYIAHLQLSWLADVVGDIKMHIVWTPNTKEWFGGITDAQIQARNDPSTWLNSFMSTAFVENSGGNRWVTAAFQQNSGASKPLNQVVLKVIRLTDGWP